MMLKTTACALTMIISIATTGFTQPAALVLSPDDQESLTPEAREAFEQAVQTLYADPLESFSALTHAAELNPEIIPSKATDTGESPTS